MKTAPPYREYIIQIVCYLYILLFVYAAVSKLLDFENFQAQLGQSPLISAYTGIISIAIPALEIALSIFLAFPKFRLVALIFSYGLMMMFTTYIIVILNYSSYVPCSCGGILEKMGWSEHLAFNCAFIVLAVPVIILLAQKKLKSPNNLFAKRKKMAFIVILVSVASVATIIILYFTSEDLMHKKNPFVRRFIPGTSVKTEEVTLANNSYYFAGAGNGRIYLANNAAPLHITVIDTTLKSRQSYTIKLENYSYPFAHVQVRVSLPYFYLMDGTVPVLFKGNVSNWEARVTMKEGSHYFSSAEVIGPNHLAIRTENKFHEHLLADLYIGNIAKVDYKNALLEKQIDGFFDTDGMMHYDAKSKRFVYLYFYRNQFIVTDSSLTLKHRGTTIDTTSHAKIKVAHIKGRGERKLAAPPYIANIQSAVYDNFLFVNSALQGKFEDKKMWEEASVVDVYNITDKTYLSSMYIYDAGKLKMNDILVIDDNLYVLLGYHLHRYKLRANLSQKP